MGAGALFSVYEGKGDKDIQKTAITHAIVLVSSITIVLNVLVYAFMDPILTFLRVPEDVWQGMRVALAYMLAPFFGETGIWVAIPIGWVLADVTGILYMRRNTRKYNKYNKE